MLRPGRTERLVQPRYTTTARLCSSECTSNSYGMRSPLSPDHFGDSRSFCSSQQLEHGIRTEVGFRRYLPDALASGSQPSHSLEQLVIVLSLRSPSDASLLPCACQPCLYALADSDPLLLRNGGKDAAIQPPSANTPLPQKKVPPNVPPRKCGLQET